MGFLFPELTGADEVSKKFNALSTVRQAELVVTGQTRMGISRGKTAYNL